MSAKFTRNELQKFNGVTKPEVYLAVGGKVFDVTSGAGFYGPGGPYAIFAGHDASRGLALNSVDPEMIKPFDQPIDTLDDLTQSDINVLKEWESFFVKKYKCLGELVE